METKQKFDLNELKKLLPEQAKVEVQRKKGQTNKWFLEVDVKIVPSVSVNEHEKIVKSIVEFYGEDLIEVYTETQGYHFYVYLRMSQTQPTTIEF